MAAVTQDQLRKERGEKEARCEEIRAEVRESGEMLEGERSAEWNQLNADIDHLTNHIDQLDAMDERLRSLAEKDENVEKPEQFQTRRPSSVRGDDIWDLSTVQRSWDNPDQENRQLHDRAMRAVEKAKFPHPRAQKDHEDVQSHLETLLGDSEGGDRRGAGIARHYLYTGSPAYRRAFTKYLSGEPRTEEEGQLLYRAMSLTTTSGGFAVPFVLDPTLIPTSNGAVNPYRQVGDVITINVDEWRGVSSGGVTPAFQAEAAATTDVSPTLAQPTVTTEMARAAIPFSIEIGMDWGSFATEMAGDIQDGKDVLEATKFAVGSGTNEPFGVVTGATTVFTAADTDSLVLADIYSWHNALPPRFRNGAVVTINNNILDKIRQIDTAGGSGMLTPNLQVRSAAQVATMVDGRAGVDLFGHPVYEASGQSSAVTTGQLVAVIGWFGRYYKIADRVGLTVVDAGYAQDATTGLPTGQKFLLAYWRVGAKVLHANAFRTLKLA